jgi:hypothetical protein
MTTDPISPFSRTFLFWTISLTIIGCSPNQHGSHAPQSGLATTHAYSYKFDGIQQDGTSCSTGYHGFERVHEFCMTLQNAEKNNRCGLEKRFERFQAVCNPLRYRFADSRACVLTIAKPEFAPAELAFSPLFDLNESPFRSEDVLSEIPHCLGRSSKDMGVFAGGTQEFFVGPHLPEIVMHIQSNYVEAVARERLGESVGRSRIQYEIWDDNKKARLIELNDSGETAFSRSEFTLDGRYKFNLRCMQVVSCDSEALSKIFEREKARRLIQ